MTKLHWDFVSCRMMTLFVGNNMKIECVSRKQIFLFLLSMKCCREGVRNDTSVATSVWSQMWERNGVRSDVLKSEV